MMPLNDKELKQKWVEALRSGRYIQGHGSLRDSVSRDKPELQYCCLGVLCDIHPGVQWGDDIEDSAGTALYKGDSSNTELPSALRRELGLTQPEMDILAIMNDKGDGFYPISNYIERHY